MANQTGKNRAARKRVAAIILIVFWLPLLVQASSCDPLDLDHSELLQLKEEGYVIADRARRERFAVELVACLGDPDPLIRDDIAYEGFVALLRGKQLRPEAVKDLLATMTLQLESSAADQPGFRKPFVALVLAEVARADRIDQIFSADERAGLVAISTSYMRSIRDYRGFDAQDGWRHAVAHTADLQMQLTLNQRVTQAQLLQIRDAIGSQIAPPGEHFYIYGENERLARPILFMAARDAFTDSQWIDWFATLAAADPFDSWNDVYASQAGWAKIHNTRAFAEAIYVNAVGSDEVGLQAVAAGALELLKAMP